ncbi:hypothetical protein FRC03_005831 [Tulasnella sp. 419]|nr:hypothetical protein FRC03_005831 [Tulasnella sp. 419]
MVLVTSLLLVFSGCASALTPYTGTPPKLPSRQPFGFGSAATGGSTNTSAVYLVKNANELREAIALPYTKTIYVDGTMHGNQLSDGTMATCQTYIDRTGSTGAAIRQFNFAQYLLSLNSTYMALVSQASAANQLFEGKNATEYKSLLSKMNGWRPVVQNTQKAAVQFAVKNNTSIIGLNANAALNGITLSLNAVNNIVVRNLKLVSPKDCFPAPETYPSSWNAKYDAMALVTATNVWVDGCELQDQLNGEYVTPDYMWPGWQVDRFDGLFDVEDGSDKVTFSHNIVRNHHKSLLFGGGEKEAERDIGKMRITLFANHFNQSASRNPLMRFGTFELVANLFTSQNHKSPLFNIENSSGSTQTGTCSTNIPAAHQYHLGVYNQSKVYLSSNTFKQTGCYANDQSRIFTITESTNSALPALVCVDESSFKSTLNQVVLDLKNVVTKTLTYAISAGRAVQNGVLLKCDGVVRSGTTFPKTFKTNDEVVTYVQQNAGQLKA